MVLQLDAHLLCFPMLKIFRFLFFKCLPRSLCFNFSQIIGSGVNVFSFMVDLSADFRFKILNFSYFRLLFLANVNFNAQQVFFSITSH